MTEPDAGKKPYRVVVADNFHYGEVDEQREGGEYATSAEAVLACQRIVEDSLRHLHKPGMSADDLFDKYTSFGDDPFVVGPDAPKFSAWTYAKERCPAIISANPLPRET